MNSTKKQILFNKSANLDIISIFNLELDPSGFITKNGTRVLSNKGKEVHIDNLAGLRKDKGNLLIFTDDIDSLHSLL